MALTILKIIIGPVALVFIAWAIGIIFDKIVLAKLYRLMEKTRWTGDDIFIQALRGKIAYLFFYAGVYGASLMLPIPGNYLTIIHNILQILAILTITTIASRIAVDFVTLYTQKEEGFLPSVSIFTNLTRVLVYALGVLVALQSLGISITPILTALGVGGLAVALALQNTLSDLFSGLQLIASRQFKLGDYVRLNTGEEGYITDITWRSTTIRALANNLIIVPNSKLAGAIITNFCQPLPNVSVSVELSIPYYSNLTKVEEIAVEVSKKVLREFPGGVVDFVPSVRFSSFDDSGLRFSVGLLVKEFADQFLIKHEFIKLLNQRFKDENIQIAFPTRTVYLEKE